MTRPHIPASRRQRSRNTTFFGVLGDLLITAGVLVLLFLAWQLWWNDAVIAGQQTTAARDLSEQWSLSPQPLVPDATDEGLTDPVVMEQPTSETPFGVMYVPRFGTEKQHAIAEGIGTNVLNSNSIGVGHYPGTQMPGEIGNFAVAAHRSAYGGAMHLVNELEIGDPIYIQTRDGWYTYRFRDQHYVQPTDIGVLDPVPNVPGAVPSDRIITLTTCNPLYSTDERVIAYGIFESFKPTSAGPPVAIAGQVKEWGA